MPRRLLLATTNEGKLRDFRLCLEGADWQLLTPTDVGLALSVEETGWSYEENARLKARAYFEAAGLPTVGEDSGLEIDALDGAPGVLSARYLGLPDGPVKNAKILELVSDVLASKRGCRYHCAIVLVGVGGREHVFEGTCVGRVAMAPAGSGGFGFDPIVEIPRLHRTLAQLDDDERLLVNHRGKAARKLARHLRRLG